MVGPTLRKQGLGAVDVAQNIRMGGPWDETEKSLHINALELKAAEFGLKSLTNVKSDIPAHLKMDNMSAVAHINRMGETRSPILLKISLEIWECCLQRGITLESSLLSESEQRTLEFSNHHSSLAVASVLTNAIGNVNINTNIAPSKEEFTDKSGGRDPPNSRKQNLKTSGVESFRTERELMGLSGDASQLLVSGWRKGTQSSYNSCWRHWDRWCCERDLDPFRPRWNL
ncbi:unnamed protein product [Mytilus coruscus]|uniref:Uncharacterized protein n=1 Tax=Mytilus coruscus TaxID=42192 RepID=A0A6J8E0Q0_MYTCO|nr:unnamed protein product [Mytilus coruscus]